MISKGKLEHVLDSDPRNHSKQYLVPVGALPAPLQAKYYGKKPVKTALVEPPAPPKPLDAYNADERQEIDLWIGIVREWEIYRAGRDLKTADKGYAAIVQEQHPDLRVSADILYRKRKAVRAENWDGLLDKRGKWRKGKSSIDETIWQAFLSYYLDESQHPIERCYQYTQLWAQQAHPELLDGIPAYSSFYRRIQADIAEPVKVLGREGPKAYRDRCAPYIRRVYDDMQSNEYWIGDNHTFDIITEGANGQRHRLYLTAFFDALSGIFTGFSVVENPSSDATIYALRKGILQYGIPQNLYLDNGREFLTHDVGGLGHRRKKNNSWIITPPPIFNRLGITMTNALVRNARAKTIERRFRDVKDQLSRLFATYTGGTVVEKPERLKDVLKSGNVPTDKQLFDDVETLLTGYFNESQYNGPVARFKGMNRMDVYLENLHKKRVASEEDLSLMLMRTEKPHKVGRRGVHVTVAGCKLDYWDDDLVANYFGKLAYVRYDPEDLTNVRVYDENDRYIKTVAADDLTIQRYGADKESIKAAQRRIRSAEKAVKQSLQDSILAKCDRITALDLVLQSAATKKAARMECADDNAVLEIQRVDEQPIMKQAVGDYPLGKMVDNLEKRLHIHHEQD